MLVDDGQRVTALRVDHPPVTEATRCGSRCGPLVTFSADTTYFQPLGDFAKGTDVLVHEAMLPEGIEAVIAKTGLGEALRRHLLASHTVVEDAARIAKAAGAGRLVLHHLIPVDDPDFTEANWLSRAAKVWDGTVILGHDGMVVPL